ncbi:hypothetical protein U9M48_016272 [Paspalum notatum var. saurae]|uniref:Negatively light-regulated protein n=2 Tax=Paspalum notatum var. saurae TaxID=547442 RepID=A0AAQ3WME0_PASNO
MADGNSSASAAMGEEAFIENKYGGMAPKKPLISKDHERAYFDSADWVLGKQVANSSTARAAIESLKPKLKLHCIVMALLFVALHAEDAPSPASPSQAGLRVQLKLCQTKEREKGQGLQRALIIREEDEDVFSWWSH